MPYYPYALFYWFLTSIWLYNFIFALKRNIIILACQYQHRKRLQPKGWAIEFGFCPFFWHQHIDRVHGFQGRSLREEGCTCCHHRGPCPSVLWKWMMLEGEVVAIPTLAQNGAITHQQCILPIYYAMVLYYQCPGWRMVASDNLIHHQIVTSLL